MKKYLFGFTALLFAVTLSFAFTPKDNSSTKESTAFAAKIYEYTAVFPVPNPPATEAQVENTSNWTLRTVAPSCNGSSNKFCRIEFDDSNTSLTQALNILGDRIAAGQSFTHGTTYTVGANSVTIYLKS